MHLVCLGAVCRMLYLFRNGSKDKDCKLSLKQGNSISDDLSDLKLPREFVRQPRSLKYLDRWKATEF